MRPPSWILAVLIPTCLAAPAAGQDETPTAQEASADRARPGPAPLEPDQLRARSLFGQAQLHLERGTRANALRLCEQAVELDPRYSAPLMLLGQSAFAAEAFPRAADWYRRALDLDPRNAELLAVVTECHLRSGDLAAAQSWLDVARQQKCWNQGLDAQHTRLLLAQGRWPEAEAILVSRRERRPDDATLQTRLLDVYEASEQWEKALPLAHSLHRKAPADRSMRFRYWRLLLAAKFHETAAAEMEAALLEDAEDRQTRALLIQLYSRPYPQPERKAAHEAVLREKNS